MRTDYLIPDTRLGFIPPAGSPVIAETFSPEWQTPRDPLAKQQQPSPANPEIHIDDRRLLSPANCHESGQGGYELPRCGNEFDFERIYQMYSRRVFTLCLRMVGNRAEAEDLTQEAFILLLRKVETFRGESAFRTWMFRLVTNVVLMHLRRRKSAAHEISLDEDTNSGTECQAPPKEFGAADCKLIGAIDRISLERAIWELPRGFRLVFLLHDVEGFNHVQIAGMLGLAVGTSKSQLHKARCRLRLLLRAAGYCHSERGNKPRVAHSERSGESLQLLSSGTTAIVRFAAKERPPALRGEARAAL